MGVGVVFALVAAELMIPLVERATTAARMRGRVPQRQMLVMLEASWSSVGEGLVASQALMAMIMPDWQ